MVISMFGNHGAFPSSFGGNLRRLFHRALGSEQIEPSVEMITTSVPSQRRSNGLKEFWSGMGQDSCLQILDLGSASQATMSFVTGRGHKFYAEDILSALHGNAEFRKLEDESDEHVQRFLDAYLKYDDGQFDGVLGWDVLDFLADPLVKPVVDHLHKLVKPGGALLAFFHAEPAGKAVPQCQYRISTEESLEIKECHHGKLQRQFHNRSIENLFRRFASLKFYLSRDNLREVVIVR